MQLPLTLLFTLLPFFLDVQAKEHNGRKLVNAAQLTTPARILAAGSGKESDGTFSGRLMMKRAVSGRDLFKRAGECADPVQYLCENVDGCCKLSPSFCFCQVLSGLAWVLGNVD